MARIVNLENFFGKPGSWGTFFFGQTYGNWQTSLIAKATFDNPIDISPLGCTFQAVYHCVNNYYHWVGYELYYRYSYPWFRVIFNDGTSSDFTPSVVYNHECVVYKVSLSQFSSKKISSIEVYCNYCLYNHCYGSWQYWYEGFCALGDIQITNVINEIQNQSNKIDFKIGSNYLSLLEANGINKLINGTGNITTSESNLQNLYSQMCTIPTHIQDFYWEYTLPETPDETSNAKLFFRYRAEKEGQILGGVKIVVTYYGGTTYTLCSQKQLYTSQDLLFSIPDGKYIEKVEVSATEMRYLEGVSIGLLQIYNNVPSARNSRFVQYPALEGTAADTDRTHHVLMDVPSIMVNSNGYLMMSENGIYLLPGSNVIRKQKLQPNENSEPALSIGDIWLDYSQEPLMAYQYTAKGWIQCHDVPIGYVTLFWTEPSGTATKSSNNFNISFTLRTFAQEAVYSGTYTFTYTSSGWKLNGTVVTLSRWGLDVSSGTPSVNDTITVSFTAAVSSIQSIDLYPINQNGYNVNAFTDYAGAVAGRDGRDGVAGRDGKNGRDGAKGDKGDPGIGVPEGGQVGDLLVKTTNSNYGTAWTTVVPTGGKKGEFLAKKSDSNFDTEWGTVLSTALMNGGRTGETLIKKSSDDLDFDWGTLESLPPGGNSGNALIKSSNSDFDVEWADVQSLPPQGTTGDVLSKSSNSDFDVGWTTPHYVPPAGNINQALVKLSNNDYDYAWADVAGGGGDTDFIDMKINMFFLGQNNGYLGLNTEDFKTIDSIDTSLFDGADVVSTYWNEAKRQIYNSSESPISYCFDEIDQVVRGFYVEILKDGLVTLQYSTDSGTTWNTLTEKTTYSVTTTSLLIKVTQPVGSKLMAFGILLK